MGLLLEPERADSIGDQLSSLLSQSRVDVEHEGISISAQLGDDKRTRYDVTPEMNASSRDRRQNLATTTGAFALIADQDRFAEYTIPGGLTLRSSVDFPLFGRTLRRPGI